MADLDLQSDFAQVTDELQPVTLRSADGSTSTAIPGALRRAVTTAEAAASDGRYTSDDVRWHLSAAELSGAPQLADQVIDGTGQIWTILETRLATCSTRWECISRNLAIAAGLDQLITIQQKQIVKGAGGAAEASWVDYQTGVLARIQMQTQRRGEQHGRQSGVVRARVFMQQQIIVDNGFRVVAADGTIWEIEGFQTPDSITDLFTIDVLRRLWRM